MRVIAGCLLLLAACGRTRTEPQMPVPPDVQAFIERGRAALKAANTDDLRALAETPETLAWLSHRARPGDTNWQLNVIQLPPSAPSSAPRCAAIFSAYHSCQSIGDHVHLLERVAGVWRIGKEIPETDTMGYRVRDHKLSVTFDLPKAACDITDEVTIERTGSTFGPCLLRLSSVMRLQSATIDGKPLTVQHAPGVIVFQTPPEKQFVVSLKYHGDFTQPGMDTYIRESEVFLNSYWYPHIARLPAKHGVTVTVPKGWTAVGQGEPMSVKAEGQTTTFAFRNEIPTSYFSLDAGPYTVTSRTVDGRKLSAYQLRPDSAQANRALDALAGALAFFEKSFGSYPYSHYEMVQTLGPFGGALEAYSFATFRGGFGAVEHELAHTWWGGVVPNPYTKSQWNESFAVYSDGLYQRQRRGAKMGPAPAGVHPDPGYGREYLTQYAVPAAIAFDTENGSHSGVGYGKGAQVLAMLEDLLGTEMMIRCMRRFREELTPGEAADWPDFERAVNKVTGKDYRWFFEQWVERGGVPVVRLAEVKLQRAGGKAVVSGKIVQDGKPYRLFLPIVIEMADGTTVTKVVEAAETSTRFQVEVSGTPELVKLDPEGTVLMAGGTGAADPFTARLDGLP
jgi:aminopeptidase N